MNAFNHSKTQASMYDACYPINRSTKIKLVQHVVNWDRIMQDIIVMVIILL